MAKDATKDAPKPAAKPQAAAKSSGDKAQRKKGEGAAQAPSIAKGRPKGTGTVPARLKETFHKTLLPALMKARGYTNPWQVPRVEKIVINMGVGEGRENAKVLDFATAELQAITGQKPVVTRAKKSIANFKLREGVPIGAKVTLRGARMYEFLDRLVNVALPRVRAQGRGAGHYKGELVSHAQRSHRRHADPHPQREPGGAREGGHPGLAAQGAHRGAPQGGGLHQELPAARGPEAGHAARLSQVRRGQREDDLGARARVDPGAARLRHARADPVDRRRDGR